MKKNVIQRVVMVGRLNFFSPGGFLFFALFIAVGFLAVHLAGLRDYTTIVSGTRGPNGASWEKSAICGSAYFLAYMAFAIVAPILVLAAGLLAVWRKQWDSALS
jgi:hypothetical protein